MGSADEDEDGDEDENGDGDGDANEDEDAEMEQTLRCSCESCGNLVAQIGTDAISKAKHEVAKASGSWLCERKHLCSR